MCARAELFARRPAIAAGARTLRYDELAARSQAVAQALLGRRADLDGERVAFLVQPGIDWVVTQWAIWRAGGMAVPLATMHPPPELAYVIEDSDAATVVADADAASRVESIARDLGARFLTTAQLAASGAQPSDGVASSPSVAQRGASILYTSGTTGRPKGVVTTHANIAAAVETLVEAWGWSEADRILNVLPLHHVHGIINVLSCALWSGACCEFMPFDARQVWRRFASGDITLFMAVPTIYRRLIAAWEAAPSGERAAWSRGAGSLRLMVSGSAALPVPTLERWRDITGHTLLERYGMTEIGMALSNPLEGERVAGTVGTPLGGVEARLVDAAGQPVLAGTPGQIEVRGPQVFLEYWRRPAETAAAFRNGWFRTGDEAVIEDGRWRILGRSSIDILKTAGYKVSALEIEDVLRGHDDVADCAVIGLPDEDLGERVAAAIVPAAGAAISVPALLEWVAMRLAPYKVPRTVQLVAELPRNAMGKVTKPEVRALFTQEYGTSAGQRGQPAGEHGERERP
ncbi:MAG: acyl-CoA synthetase [Longimicrobiales bacterium]